MTDKTQLEILKKGVEEWNKWRDEERTRVSKEWDEYYEDYNDVISESDGPYYYPDEPKSLVIKLNDADFSGQDLSNIDFCGANLENSKFKNTKLIRAEFSGANLTKADFSFANLSNADFSGAILNEANFDSAICAGTKFDNKDLSILKMQTPDYPSYKDTQNSNKSNLEKHNVTEKAREFQNYEIINSDANTNSANDIGKLKVFLCHSSGDKKYALSLYNQLCSQAMDPWLDQEKLLPGQKWENEIKKAVKASHVVVVLLSTNSINKRGFVQKEIAIALDIADEQPEDSIFIIPVKVEECEMPNRLSHLQYIMLSDPKSFNKLMSSLKVREKELKTYSQR